MREGREKEIENYEKPDCPPRARDKLRLHPTSCQASEDRHSPGQIQEGIAVGRRDDHHRDDGHPRLLHALLPHHWPLLTIRRELQRRVQGSHVERGHVAGGDCNAAAPYPAVHYTPLVVLSAIIISAMLRLIDYHVVLHPW